MGVNFDRSAPLTISLIINSALAKNVFGPLIGADDDDDSESDGDEEIEIDELSDLSSDEQSDEEDIDIE